MTRDPEVTERERFGDVDIVANMWGTRRHREMIKAHEARKQLRYTQTSDIVGNGFTQTSRKQQKVKLNPEILAEVRSYIERTRNGEH